MGRRAGLADKPLVRRQIALASLVFVSKADIDPSMAFAWESQIRAAFQGHALQSTRMGVAPAGSPDPWAGILPQHGEKPSEGPSFQQARALTFHWQHPLDADSLETLFLRRPERGEVLRAKGVCSFQGWPVRNDGSDRWLFQLADGRLEITPLPPLASGELAARSAVVIGLDLLWSEWKAQLRTLERAPLGARQKRPLSGTPEPC